MAIRNIVTIKDSVLRKKSRPVVKFDEKLWMLLDDMKDTLKKADGVGLAAVQVGILRRVVIVDVGDGKPVELINPEIVEQSGEQEGQEGCLSLPGEWGIVTRPEFVKVRAQNRKGQWCMHKGEGLKARCFCHEIDHLDGIVFTDKAKHMLTEEELKRLNEEE